MRDLVISVIANYDWPQLRTWANSLCRSGFQGDKVLFVRNISQEARDRLTAMGFWLFDHYARPEQLAREASDYLELGRNRFKIMADCLLTCASGYRYVIFTDVRDLVFQTNPSIWLEKQEHKLICAHEGWLIKNETWNSRWMREAGYSGFNDFEALCSGSFAGASTRMLDVFVSLALQVRPGVCDQATFNHLIRTRFKDVAYIPRIEEGFAATCAAYRTEDFISGVVKWNEEQGHPSQPTDEIPIFDKVVGTVRTSDGTPFCIVHQYDRDANWKEIIERKYE